MQIDLTLNEAESTPFPLSNAGEVIDTKFAISRLLQSKFEQNLKGLIQGPDGTAGGESLLENISLQGPFKRHITYTYVPEELATAGEVEGEEGAVVEPCPHRHEEGSRILQVAGSG